MRQVSNKTKTSCRGGQEKMSDNEQDILSDASKSDLAKFLSKVDEIGDLVKGLSVSQDRADSDEAIKKADAYLKGSGSSDSNPGFSRTVVNAPSSPSKPTSQQEFCRTLEEDARERAERRKEREVAGREWKKKGTQAFRQGRLEEAIEAYSEAIREIPWVISLYTNRALCYNKLGQYEKAIKDCDTALKFEPSSVRAHVHKGKAMTGMGEFNQAVKCYQAAIELNPEPSIKTEIQAALESVKLAHH